MVLFHSWLDAVVFGVVTTFFTGIITAVIVKVDTNKMKSHNA